MTPELQAALQAAAQTVGATAIDECVFHVFPELTANLNPDDPAAVKAAMESMVQRSPALFRREKDWSEMEPGSDEWRQREERFLAGLRKSRPIVNEWREIDAGRLSPQEYAALDKAVRGHANAFDRGLLVKALARQRQENAALSTPPDAA